MSFKKQSPMVDPSHFAMIPRSDVPRSVFRQEHAHKTTFNAQDLIPIYVQEVLPGDVCNLKMTAFTRLATLLFPLMDTVELCSFFFFVPNRLVWSNWEKFMGARIPNPDSSTSFLVPQVAHNVSAPASLSIYDYFGLPISLVSPAVGTYTHNALPLRAYNLIYNEWFRDENLVNSATVPLTDGPDTPATYAIRKRAKRHDYFTSALPFPQKGTAVTFPMSGFAPVNGLALDLVTSQPGPQGGFQTGGAAVYNQYSGFPPSAVPVAMVPANQGLYINQHATTGFPQLFADMGVGVTATINAVRQAFQIQRLLERDARGGTRYTEILRAHFGVASPDARLQRPEYLGGGCSAVTVTPVAQTSVTAATPQGNLSGVGYGVATHGFSKAFVEHGYVLGLVSVRANLTYQQGLRRMWTRLTRYDFYWPAFAHLGEQTVLNREIRMVGGGSAADEQVFGYQERWAEYRFKPSQISGQFRSGIAGTLDAWHLSEHYTSTPALNQTFIEAAPPMARVYAAGATTDGQQFLFDSLFEAKLTRPMPVYSVPGFIDRF